MQKRDKELLFKQLNFNLNHATRLITEKIEKNRNLSNKDSIHGTKWDFSDTVCCVSLFSAGVAARPSSGPGLRAQCEHHEGKICQPASSVTNMAFSAEHKKV